MSDYTNEDPRIHGIRTKIRVVPNFPKPGLFFLLVLLLHFFYLSNMLIYILFLSNILVSFSCSGFLLAFFFFFLSFVFFLCFHGFHILFFSMVGIMFQDITTLLLDPKAFKDTIDLFVERYKGKNISVVAGKEQT